MRALQRDLKADLSAAITRIADFLGWPVTPQVRELVAHLASFGWMQANSERFTGRNTDGRPLFRPSGFTRKGETNDYKMQLSVDQESRIFRRCREALPAGRLAFLDID